MEAPFDGRANVGAVWRGAKLRLLARALEWPLVGNWLARRTAERLLLPLLDEPRELPPPSYGPGARRE